jgi:chromosome segregation ATPase
MDLWSMIAGSLIAASISTVFSVVQYYAIQRREERRDKEFDRLRTDLATLREGRIAEIERRIEAETRGRKAIHDEMGKLPERFLSTQESDKQHRAERELRAEETRRIERTMDRQTAAIGELSQTVAGLTQSVKLLLDDRIKHVGG